MLAAATLDQRSLKFQTIKMLKKHSVRFASPLGPAPAPSKAVLSPAAALQALDACLDLKDWGLLDEDEQTPAAMAETAAVLAKILAKRLADAQTPEGLAAATAQQRSIFGTFLLRHIQHNISRAKVTRDAKPIKACWLTLYRNQCDRALADQDRLDAYDHDMWAWVHDQDEYKHMTEAEFEAYGSGFSQYWEEKYDAWVLANIPKDPHRDAEGNIEACRYFNTPIGCHPPEGQKCPYRHVAGKAPEPDECKFFHTPRGCRSGTACPFKHTVATASAGAAAAAPALDFAAARTGGGSWRSAGAAGGAGAASDSSSGWEVAGTKPRPSAASAGGGGRSAAAAPCKFFKSARGCKNGSSCPYPHV